MGYGYVYVYEYAHTHAHAHEFKGCGLFVFFDKNLQKYALPKLLDYALFSQMII